MAKPKAPPKDNLKAIHDAITGLRAHPLLSYLAALANAAPSQKEPFAKGGFARICVSTDWNDDPRFSIELNPWQRSSVPEWTHVLAQAYLHIALLHIDPCRRDRISSDDAWRYACEIMATDLLAQLSIGRRPEALEYPIEVAPGRNAEDIAWAIGDDLVAAHLRFGCRGLAGLGQPTWQVDRTVGPFQPKLKKTLSDALANGIRAAVTKAVDTAGAAARGPATRARNPNSLAERARSWFIANYPLLAALAAAFEIVEDAAICERFDIAIAAVSSEERRIYINPKFPLTYGGLQFVMAHELLHVGLRHEARRQGRDPFLWNIACDYVINAWLIEMGVGELPTSSLMLDLALGFEKESAEAIYDRIVSDLRMMRRLKKSRTLRGIGLGDMLSERPPSWWTGAGCDLDTFYRRALHEGLELHLASPSRGLLPGDMIDEIRAIHQPPIPWDVKLGQWLDAFFPPLESRRSFARASRRQSSTPEIPRPVYIRPLDLLASRTFGVVLDTSGSMAPQLLARCLGAIASYAMSREVPLVRVVQCDAGIHDMGYVEAGTLLNVVEIRGRGGTVLMPAILRLEGATDFPKDAPILVITDGMCDQLTVKREHAYLMPDGKRLPFQTRATVFHFNDL
jgi:predicted metal-dependent peptidase